MSIWDDIFGDNPADKAMPYYDKIPGMEKNYYNPYIERGNSAYNQFNPIYQRMASDPTGFLNSIMGSYAPSKSFQLKRDEMNRAAGNTAAAGGMRGSLSDVSNEARISDSLMGEDMQDWLKNVLGIQQGGLQGEQHLYDTGFDASRGLASDLSNVYGTQGSLAFQGQANRNQNISDLISSLIKGGAAFAGMDIPGGGTVGGDLYKKAGNFF